MEKKTIRIKPSWGWAMKALLATLANGSEEGKEIARDELRALADNVDKAKDSLENITLAVKLAKAHLDSALEETDGAEGLRRAELAQQTLEGLINGLEGGNL